MTHCPGCGKADCSGCLSPIDPPHFCTTCGHRLRTQVTPTGWTAYCRRCDVTTTTRN